MSNSDRPVYRLYIHEEDPALLITVFDSQDRIHATNYDQEIIDVKLPKALYTVRAERDGQFADTIVRLNCDHPQVSLNLPPRFTPVPLPGAESSHEYYTYSAWELSKNPTSPDIPWNGNPDAGLMVFIRAYDKEAYEDENLIVNLKLRSTNGELITDFTSPSVQLNADGWAGWSAKISSGMLILELTGEYGRQLPIYLLPGFQTQIFLMHNRRPLFEDMRVFTQSIDALQERLHSDPYDIHSETSRSDNAVDVGTSALQNGVKEIGPRLVSKFLNAKFANPLLGLIGAYLLILRRRAKYSSASDPSILSEVLSNLEGLIPQSGDLAALKIMAEPWIGETQVQPVENAPIFLIGTEVLIEKAATRDGLINDGSLLDSISDRLVTDSVWTAWEPIPLPPGSRKDVSMSPSMSWVESAIVDAVAKNNSGLSQGDLARQIGVTKGAITSHYANLLERAKNQPKELKDTGYDISVVRRSLASSIDSELFDMFEDKLESLDQLAPVTYQGLYPSLKKAVAIVKESTDRVAADDNIRELLSEDGRRRLLLSVVENNLGLNLKEISETAKKAHTVRDVAALIVEQMKSKF